MYIIHIRYNIYSMYTVYNETVYVFIYMKNKYINKKKCQTNDRIQVPTHNIGMHTDR